MAGSPIPRASSGTPRSGPRYSVAGRGMSSARRSAPQFSHVSSPSKLSYRQTGQSISTASGPPAPPGSTFAAPSPQAGLRATAFGRKGGRRPRSFDRPDLAGEQGCRDVALARLLGRGADLLVDERVVRRPIDPPKDADRDRELRPEHPRQDQREVRVLRLLVVDQQVVLLHAIDTEGDDLGVEPAQADALVAFLAEDHRLAMPQDEHAG